MSIIYRIKFLFTRDKGDISYPPRVVNSSNCCLKMSSRWTVYSKLDEKQTFLINLVKMTSREQVSWLCESRTMIVPKRCPTLMREEPQKKRGPAEKLSKRCFFGIYCLFGCFKKLFRTLFCCERRSFSSLLSSNLCSALLCCRMDSLHVDKLCF